MSPLNRVQADAFHRDSILRSSWVVLHRVVFRMPKWATPLGIQLMSSGGRAKLDFITELKGKQDGP